MANAEISEVESLPVDTNEGVKRKSRTKLIIVGVLVIALVAGGFVFFHMRSSHKTGAGAASEPVKTAELYLPLDPAFVVNFQDDDATRYLQVGVTLMSHDAAAIQAVKDNDPVIRNALVMLFSSQTFDQLSTTAGKQKLQSEALAAVRKIVADKLGKPGVDALYFTSFVMQ
jgi:flagellar FliL protein